MEEFALSFPSLYGHAFSMYGNTSHLVYSLGSESVILESQEGVHQGDPLGLALFSIVIHKILSDLLQRHSTVVVLAYLDDAFICGPSVLCMEAYQYLKIPLTNVGLVICERKCQAYSPSPQSRWLESIPLMCLGMEILGTPVGADDYIILYCLSSAKMGQDLCEMLCKFNDP